MRDRLQGAGCQGSVSARGVARCLGLRRPGRPGRVEYSSHQGQLLLQIFSENQLGPIFFEFIQRKGDQGFGEGNFKALFESMELDQMRRGVLKKE